jgi:hypothetical protein
MRVKRVTTRSIVVATGLLALGWTAGRATAQTEQADFEIRVTSPDGETTITCVRGCGLQFGRYVPDRTMAQPSFTYRCSNPVTGSCGSGTLHGWVRP